MRQKSFLHCETQQTQFPTMETMLYSWIHQATPTAIDPPSRSVYTS
jgi:hypothetical protein